MSERAEAMATEFEQINHTVIACVARCSPDDWRAICADEQWPVGVVARHIARAYEVHPELIRLVATEQATLPQYNNQDSIHESNARQAREWTDCGHDEALELLRRYGARAAGVVRSLSDEELDRTATIPLLGDDPVRVEQLVTGMIDHARIHLASIQATIGCDAPHRYEWE